MVLHNRNEADGEALRPRARVRALRLGLLVLVALGLLGVLRSVAVAYADERARAELAALGLDAVELHVESVDTERLRLRDVRLGPDLTIRAVELRYGVGDLMEGTVREVLLDGLRWESAASVDALRRSSPARVLTALSSPSTSATPQPVFRLRDARATLGGVVVRLDGAYRPGGGRFEVTSPLGVHGVEITQGEHALSVRARGQAPRRDLVNLYVELPARPDGAWALRLDARLDALEAPVGARRLALGHVVASVVASARGERLDALRADATLLDAEVEGLAIPRIDVHAAPDAGQIAWTLTGGLFERRGEDRLDLRGKLSPRLATWTEGAGAIAWDFAGTLPLDALPSVDGDDPRVRSQGVLELDAGAVTAEGSAVLEMDRLRTDALAATQIHASLRARAHGDAGDFTVEIREGAVVRGARVRLAETEAREVEVDALSDVRVRVSADGVSVQGERARLRAARAWTGRGGDRITAHALQASMTPRGAYAWLVEADGATRLQGNFRARARRVDGALQARRVRARGAVAVSLTDGAPRGSARLALRARQLGDADGWLQLQRARLSLPLRLDARGLRGAGRLEAATLGSRGHALGPATGRLELGPAGTDLTLECGLGGGATGQLALALRPTGDRLRVDVPPVTLRRGAPLTQLLADVTGLRLQGPVSGALDCPLDAAADGAATLALHGARLEVDGLRVDGAHARFELSRLSPAESAAPSELRWSALRVGGLRVGGEGHARLRLASSGALSVDDLAVAVGGGRVRVAPFVYDVDRPSVELDARARGLDLSRILPELTGGRARGHGRLDGRVRMSLGHDGLRSLQVREARLQSRGPGHFRFAGDQALGAIYEWARPLSGSLALRRVTGALTDFDYGRLDVRLDPRGGAPSPWIAHVVGRGRTVHQDVDLTLRFHGLQRLFDEALRIGAPPRQEDT